MNWVLEIKMTVSDGKTVTVKQTTTSGEDLGELSAMTTLKVEELLA